MTFVEALVLELDEGFQTHDELLIVVSDSAIEAAGRNSNGISHQLTDTLSSFTAKPRECVRVIFDLLAESVDFAFEDFSKKRSELCDTGRFPFLAEFTPVDEGFTLKIVRTYEDNLTASQIQSKHRSTTQTP